MMSKIRIGWIGYVDDKPFWEKITDDYCHKLDGSDAFQGTNIFKSKKEARKRFEDVRPVYVEKS
jgi:hypothetical protein